MANTTVQLEVEVFIRETWMPERFLQKFTKDKVRLISGGLFEFDAVSPDALIGASISTSGAKTKSGKKGAGKIFKLRSDMLYLLQADFARRFIVLTEKDMSDECVKEKYLGRHPIEIEFFLAELPQELRQRLESARVSASDEVSPVLGYSANLKEP